MPDPCPLPSDLDPTRVYPRGPRRHDDRGNVDPALRELARTLDRHLDALLRQARTVVALGREPTRPLELLGAVERLETKLKIFDCAASRISERASHEQDQMTDARDCAAAGASPGSTNNPGRPLIPDA